MGRRNFEKIPDQKSRKNDVTVTMRKGDLIDINVDKMAFGGQGVGRVEGFVVFVSGAVAGDRVRARIIRKKRDYAEARIQDVLSPSLDRVEAPCPYFGFCGGCQWQHMRYDMQLIHKHAHVAEALAHVGGLHGVRVHPVLPSERAFGYRNKMEFSFSNRRWYLPSELDRKPAEPANDFALGLHVPGTYNKVIDIEACLLQQEAGNHMLRAVKALAEASRIPAYGLKSHQGFWRYLALRYSQAYKEWMINVVTSCADDPLLSALADQLSGQFSSIRTIVHNINRRKGATAVGEEEKVLWGDGIIRDKIGPFVFQISANSFFQTNALAAETLYRTVARFAALTGKESVLDLYSGTGTIPLFLAPDARQVIGIEISENAVRDARKNCKENGVDHCRFICGDMRHALSSETQRPDVMIIDPPRAGMHKDVLKQVLTMAPEKVVYVSCNPATLARDLGQMATLYDLIEIQPVDMFPHTYHIESVANLRLRKRV